MNNYLILATPFIAAGISQFLKMFLNKDNPFKARDLFRLYYAGMPSSHSAFVSSMTIVLGLTQGFSSPIFGLSLAISALTINDALKLRQYLGQQGAVLNVLIRDLKDDQFLDEKYPILIDQPEDDLDVVGVATDLVNFIKSEKNDRQIIIVSHNASLVICADTEEVLVSSGHKNTQGSYNFIYLTGSIENTQIRDEIIKVLEGGKEALKQRARKLNFKNEI